MLTLFFKIINRLVSKDIHILTFIPHGGMMDNKYGLLNFSSDNALSFLHYLLENHPRDYKFRVAANYYDVQRLKEEKKNLYPELDIQFFPMWGYSHLNRTSRWSVYFRNLWQIFFRTGFVFTSEGIPFPYKQASQKWIFLGYFIPFKNDYDVIIHTNTIFNNTYDMFVTQSLLASQIISHTYNVPLRKFFALGASRDDELMKPKNVSYIREEIESFVNYPVHKIFLYTPTHRDYEKYIHDSVRGILGFEISGTLSKILKENGAVILCKIHTKQNLDALNKQLPQGVVVHKANDSYGLCELMQVSDYLITDYTSAYFDYLLLDKPVIFNFYDVEKYKSSRGFSYDPLDSILAGGIFQDELSLCKQITKLISGIDEYSEKRKFVSRLLHKYIDSNSSERIYTHIFGQQ